MNYISEIREFYDMAEAIQLSASCICLWHALMYQANKARWKGEFSVAVSTLELRTGLKRGAIYRARNALVQAGLVSVKERDGRQSALYTMHSLCSLNEHKAEHKADTKRNTKRTQSGTQSGHKAELLDNTTYYPDVDVDVDEDIDVDETSVTTVAVCAKDENGFAKVMAHYMGNIGTMPPSMVSAGIQSYLDHMETDVVTDAIDRAAADNKRNWSYINGILKSRKESGVRNMADVAREDEEFRKSKPQKPAKRKNTTNPF